MSEQKKITSLYVITDTENGYEKIGDIDGGGFDTEWLKNHIKNYGTEGLFKKIAWMNYQVFQTMRDINEENYDNIVTKVTKPVPPPTQLIKEGEEPKPNWTSLENYKPEYNKKVEIICLGNINNWHSVKWVTTGYLRNNDRWVVRQNKLKQITLNNSVPTHWRELK